MDQENTFKLGGKNIGIMRYLVITFFLLTHFLADGQKTTKIIDKCDSTKLVKYLDKGANINEQFEEEYETGETFEIGILTYAVHAECIECVQALLNRKSAIQDFDLKVTEAFIYSLSVGNDEISSLLYAQEPIAHGICDACHGNNALMVAATYGREDWYFKLKPSSDLSYINTVGNSLVHSAASGPSQKILEDVLKIEGLDINRKDNEGLTALDYAASNADNKNAFQTLIENGADHKNAWNLMYWWSMYPDVPLTDQMIKDRRADVWLIDGDGENCLMLMSYFFHELETEPGKFARQLNTLIDIMIEDHKAGKSDLSFVHQFYSEGITMNMLDAMLFIEDFTAENPVYPKYLEFLGILCADTDYCPVYKKEYKTALKIYGEVVDEWYDTYELPKQ